MTAYEKLQENLRGRTSRWLVTGGAGFIGSHIVETLLSHGQDVVIVDNFSTGHRSNLDAVRGSLDADPGARLQLIEGDLCDPELCGRACVGADYVLHQAALGSVPRSIDDPIATHAANVTATVNLLNAARAAGIRRVVYASSSAVYGDDEQLPKIEDQTGKLLSPYAASKAICETYAAVFSRCYGLEAIGLRYFNVYGPRQDPQGSYAAVIPKWIEVTLRGEQVVINGDGTTSRDFVHVADAVQANLLAATADCGGAIDRAYNVAAGTRTDLNELAGCILAGLQRIRPALAIGSPIHGEFRAGDVMHSLADIGAINRDLGFRPQYALEEGLDSTIEWFASASG